MADRDLGPRLPQIELADLPRPIDRALKRPRRVKQRPHLPQVVIDDRLAAIKAQRSDQLPDPLPRHPRVGLQQPVDLVLERIQLRRRRRPPIIRRRRCPQRCPDRVARHPRPPRKLPDRNAADEVLATQLSPALHVQQAPSTPNSITKTKPGSPAIRTPPPPPEGGQLSTGGGGSVFTRRRQPTQLSTGSSCAISALMGTSWPPCAPRSRRTRRLRATILGAVRASGTQPDQRL